MKVYLSSVIASIATTCMIGICKGTMYFSRPLVICLHTQYVKKIKKVWYNSFYFGYMYLSQIGLDFLDFFTLWEINTAIVVGELKIVFFKCCAMFIFKNLQNSPSLLRLLPQLFTNTEETQCLVRTCYSTYSINTTFKNSLFLN